MAKNEQTQAPDPAAPPPPPPPAAETPTPKEVERQSFVAVFNIVDGVTTHAPGAPVELSRAQYDTLKALGAIEGDWKE